MLTYLHHILRRVSTCSCQLLWVESDLYHDLQPAVLGLIYLRGVSFGLKREILEHQRWELNYCRSSIMSLGTVKR